MRTCVLMYHSLEVFKGTPQVRGRIREYFLEGGRRRGCCFTIRHGCRITDSLVDAIWNRKKFQLIMFMQRHNFDIVRQRCIVVPVEHSLIL